MKTIRIAPIVEGDGEFEALPVLLRRILAEISPSVPASVCKPFRRASGSLRSLSGLENTINTVAVLHPDHFILVLIDSDDDCPKELAASLLKRARDARQDLTVSVVLGHREYETWFLAAAESLAGKRNLRPGLSAP